MSKVVVLGATSLIGKFFVDTNNEYELICFSRKNKKFNYIDLKDTNNYLNNSFKNSFLVSFSPIGLIKDLLIQLKENNLGNLKTLKGLVIYSSSSVLTKKFASNLSDKELSKKLLQSETVILSICKEYSINCVIIRPTIIYGVYKNLDDRNFSRIIKFFRKIPICIIPSRTGYRQPIHFSQLSKLTFLFLNKFKESSSEKIINQVLEVGGDEELSYKDILLKLSIISKKGLKKRCRLITIPNRIFYLFFTPFLFLKPKWFEQIYRLQADFSGFTKYSTYTGEVSKKFPIVDVKSNP